MIRFFAFRVRQTVPNQYLPKEVVPPDSVGSKPFNEFNVVYHLKKKREEIIAIISVKLDFVGHRLCLYTLQSYWIFKLPQ
jgi:hypothetical protein